VPSWEYIPGSSFYGIYFITIFFTIFRLQKGLSLLAGILAGGIYLTLTILFIDQWVNTSWINELEKAGFLILTGVLAQTASRGLVKNNYAFLATEQKLLETDERLRQLSANLPGGVFQFLWQASGKVDVLYLSSGIQDLLGVSNKEIFRKPNSLLKIFTQDHHKRFFFQASRSRHQAQDWSMELQVSAKKDLWVRAIFSGRPIKSSTEGGRDDPRPPLRHQRQKRCRIKNEKSLGGSRRSQPSEDPLLGQYEPRAKDPIKRYHRIFRSPLPIRLNLGTKGQPPEYP
jgi:PAS domain-containing protein